MLRRQPAHQFFVQRLGETGIGHGRREPAAASSSAAFKHSCSRVPKLSSATTFPSFSTRPLPIGSTEPRSAFDPDAVATGIANRRGTVVYGGRRRHHMHQLRLIGRGHDHQAGQAAEIGDVEGSGMGRSIGADQPGAVKRKANRQTLDGNVMDDLVIGALQECRINGDKGFEPSAASPPAKVTACCSAIPTSKQRFGKRSANRLRPVPEGMAAVIATIFSSSSASAISASANTFV